MIDNNQKRLLANQILAELYINKDLEQLEMLKIYLDLCVEKLKETQNVEA